MRGAMVSPDQPAESRKPFYQANLTNQQMRICSWNRRMDLRIMKQIRPADNARNHRRPFPPATVRPPLAHCQPIVSRTLGTSACTSRTTPAQLRGPLATRGTARRLTSPRSCSRFSPAQCSRRHLRRPQNGAGGRDEIGRAIACAASSSRRAGSNWSATSPAQLIVTAADASGKITTRSDDLTPLAHYASDAPAVVRVAADGSLAAMADGRAVIHVSLETPRGVLAVNVPVTVRGVERRPRPAYTRDIVPIFSKAGCNMGACHAAQYGQAGFRLSVFGYEPSADHAAIVRDRSERRVNFLEPEQSLILKKPTLQVPHGGGRRMKIGSTEYNTLAAWIAAGAPGPRASDPSGRQVDRHPVGTHHRPSRPATAARRSRLQRRAPPRCHGLAKFDSMDEGVLSVTPHGLVTTNAQGQAAALARFEGQAAIATFVLPYAPHAPLAGWSDRNFVDTLAAAKFRELGIEPAGLCSDATFLRRAYLDAIGEIPTVDETRRFLVSKDPARRQHVVDRLLGLTGDPKLDTHNDEYAAWWTLKWSDLIRNQSNDLGEQGMWAFHNWLSESFRSNKPFDQFVGELVTAKGSIYTVGPANFYRINANPADCGEATAQLFLGVRLQSPAAITIPSRNMARRITTRSPRTSPARGKAEPGVRPVRPRIGRARPPCGRSDQSADGEGAQAEAARWSAGRRPGRPSHRAGQMGSRPPPTPTSRSRSSTATSPTCWDTAWSSRSTICATNPPSNPQLMDALARHFIHSGYDLKQLLRVIMTSRLYQLDSQPNAANVADRKFYSSYHVKRLAAEALLDAVDEATGIRTKFTSLPLGTRAVELPDAEYKNYFLKTFGKPVLRQRLRVRAIGR